MNRLTISDEPISGSGKDPFVSLMNKYAVSKTIGGTSDGVALKEYLSFFADHELRIPTGHRQPGRAEIN